MGLHLAQLHLAHLHPLAEHPAELALVPLQLVLLEDMVLLGQLQLGHRLRPDLAQFVVILELEVLHLLHHMLGVDVRQVLGGLDLLVLLLQLIAGLICRCILAQVTGGDGWTGRENLPSCWRVISQKVRILSRSNWK